MLTPSPAAAQTQATKSNVLFIAADDLRVELGCYGDTEVKSPHIDRLATRGRRFNRAYCQQAVCNPSRASLMTGMRPDSLRIWDLPTHFRERRPDIVTLPELFRKHGYFTRNIGKIYHNWRQEIQGDPQSWSVPAILHYDTHGTDWVTADGKPAPKGKKEAVQRLHVPDEAYRDGQIVKHAVAALREMKDRDQPFFLAVGFWKPHLPFNAPKKYWDLYDRAKLAPPANPEPPLNVPAIAMHDARELFGYKGPERDRLTAAQVAELRHGYYAATSFLDANVGRLLDQLDELGLSANTIVVFWSDHGFHLGEHDLWAKTSNFELDARVPLIIATPKMKHAGASTEALVELLDLYPTLAELCGLPKPEHVEGRSLAPLLADPRKPWADGAFTQHPRPAYYKGEPEAMGCSVRTARHRYTEWRSYRTGEVVARELYDHAIDPRETRNVADDSKYASAVADAAKLLPRAFPSKYAE